MKTTLFSLTVTALLVLTSVVMASPVIADGVITLTGGTLSVAPQNVDFGTHGLTGYNQTFNGTTTAWTVSDPTGTGAGWKLSIKSTDFTKNGDASKKISVTGFKASLDDANVVKVDGNDKPVSAMTSLLSLSASDQVMASAVSGTGMGTYTVLPAFTLDVPAEAYAGSYTAVLTATVAVTP